MSFYFRKYTDLVLDFSFRTACFKETVNFTVMCGYWFIYLYEKGGDNGMKE